ncbi:MAG: hypothetical protein E7231_17100 [Cellulosilyticum sp.]|nr:hypothetical protein [Cellulosilyticum sp.]
MAYMNGKEVLPMELLQEVQKYFKGGIIYIPDIEGERRKWGSKTNTRTLLRERNAEIKAKKKNGSSISELMEEYHLSYDSIKKIVYR